MTPRLFAGTSGYSYKEWKGSFYPDDLPASKMLHFYAERFGTVEINNTFYRMPKKSVLASWSAEVPDSFTFVLKASQRITHIRRLKNAEDEVSYFFETAAELGAKLGPALFQLPPNARKNVDALKAFLQTIPKDRRVAFEFRHPSWFEDDVLDALRSAGAALCLADMEEDDKKEPPEAAEPPPPRPPPAIIPTADFGYLRLRRCDYTDDGLREWIARVRGQPWRDAFVFFKHEDEATGPALAARFVELYAGADRDEAGAAP